MLLSKYIELNCEENKPEVRQFDKCDPFWENLTIREDNFFSDLHKSLAARMVQFDATFAVVLTI